MQSLNKRSELPSTFCVSTVNCRVTQYDPTGLDRNQKKVTKKCSTFAWQSYHFSCVWGLYRFNGDAQHIQIQTITHHNCLNTCLNENLQMAYNERQMSQESNLSILTETIHPFNRWSSHILSGVTLHNYFYCTWTDAMLIWCF